jgi:predicted nucleic acid-binding protein
MAIDPSRFATSNVVDTCAVWNILSSRCLYSAALSASCHFVITNYVEYECLRKPRTRTRASDLELMSRLRTEQKKSRFRACPCDLSDIETLLEQRERLGKGEISSIALAMKFRQAVLTDDQKARRLATTAGHEMVQTTPHLLSWLIYHHRLADSDKDIVIAQHRELDGTIEKYFEDAYLLALQHRLLLSTTH